MIEVQVTAKVIKTFLGIFELFPSKTTILRSKGFEILIKMVPDPS